MNVATSKPQRDMAKDGAISVRLASEVKAELEKTAVADHRTLTSLVEKILIEALRSGSRRQQSAGLDVAGLIAAAFQQASHRQQPLHQSWIKISFRVGSRLPQSLLSFSIQQLGTLDLILRCMEDDFVVPAQSEATESILRFHFQKLLSDLWIGSAYEIVRLMTEPKFMPGSDALIALAHDLRMVRVPLEKHAIAAEKKLKGPLRMRKSPPKGDESDEYLYSADDPTRAHIMPTGISSRGSVMWQTIDVSAGKEYWIERREISERMVKLFELEPVASAKSERSK